MNISPRLRFAGRTTTVVFSVLMAASGLFYISGARKAVELFAALGYPDYFRVLLGLAKLLGVAALWLPVPRALREWAYAGFVFDLFAAVASHLARGEPAHALPPAVALTAVLISYFGRHIPSAPAPT
jgi:hypothetical protein